MSRTTLEDQLQAAAVSTPILQYFMYSHLPLHLQNVSYHMAAVAFDMDEMIPPGPERTAGLRKLLEAKDCFVRANLANAPTQPITPSGRDGL